MTQITNPYTEQLHEAHRKEDKNEIARLEKLSKDFLANALKDLDNNIIKTTEKAREVENNKDKLTLTALYKKSLMVYKEADSLLKESREIKKKIREEIARKRVKR